MAKILVIDDEAEQIEALRLLLRETYEVVGATTPIEAFSLTARDGFDLILLDMRLGDDVSGLTVAATIRQGKRHRTIPIIAYSGYPDFSVAEIVEAGCNDFLPRPFNREQLLSKVEYWTHPKTPKMR